MKENNSFLKGAAILSIAGIIVKILGAIYRIPLSNLIKSEGMGYYQTAYPFYTLLLTASTAGFPVAIAKIVAEKRSLGDYKGAHKVFKVSLYFLIIFGILSSIYLFTNSRRIVENIGNPSAYYSLLALSPALIFVPIMSVFRGYFQGMQDMIPTAISQIFEQSFRVFSGLILTYILLDKGVAEAAGGASLGGTIGALTGTLSIVVIYFIKRKSILKVEEKEVISMEDPVIKILRDLLTIAIPITIGAAITPIMDYIDLKLVLKRLQFIGYSEIEANNLYGNLKGMAQTLINLPQVFAVALSMSLVPAVSKTKALNKTTENKRIISSGIKVTLLIGLPCAVGLFVLSHPIIELLYYKNTAETIRNTGNLLKILSLGVVFLTLVQSLSAILQGLGRPLVPAVNLFIGAILKAVLTYKLTVIQSINIYGAAISTVAAFMLATVLDIYVLIRHTKYRLDFNYIFVKPFISSLGMGIIVQLAYKIISKFSGNTMATLISIALGGVAYLILLFLTGAISKDELKLLPKGDKIVHVVDKIAKK